MPIAAAQGGTKPIAARGMAADVVAQCPGEILQDNTAALPGLAPGAGNCCRSPSTMTKSAWVRARSVAPATAKEASARLSTGASLRPSPTMATTAPWPATVARGPFSVVASARVTTSIPRSRASSGPCEELSPVSSSTCKPAIVPGDNVCRLFPGAIIESDPGQGRPFLTQGDPVQVIIRRGGQLRRQFPAKFCTSHTVGTPALDGL